MLFAGDRPTFRSPFSSPAQNRSPFRSPAQYHSPFRSPAPLPAQHNAVVAAEQQVQAVQNASGHQAVPQIQFLGGSRLKSNTNARGSRYPAGAPRPTGRPADPIELAGSLSGEDSPLPSRLVPAGVMGSSSRGAGGASTRRAAFQPASNIASPSTPRGQTSSDADEYASPAAMPPPGAFQEPVRVPAAPKPPLSSRKRIAAPPVNAPFKRPNRG